MAVLVYQDHSPGIDIREETRPFNILEHFQHL